MINSVPSPKTELQLNLPPWVDSTICRAIANPKPVPLPIDFVVNQWSNIFDFICSFIPLSLKAKILL
nr:hypothetical protein [Nostoc sp. ChiSLP03a]MDZ8214604.1 hypothetical protein [Nostoc sp. ChiSLP03a]